METTDQIASDTKRLPRNLVQDILNKSIKREDYQQSELFSRLLPKQLTTFDNDHIALLTDHLILTSASCVNSEIIQALGVNSVISAAPELPFLPLGDQVTFRQINIRDSPNSNISVYLEPISDLIEQVASTGGRTLVFCVAGVSRSATLCIAYLMRHHRLTLLEAYNYAKSRRPRIKPNCGFFKQLIEFEKTIFIDSSVQMVFNEFVQMNIPDVYDSEYKIVLDFNRKFRRRV